MSESISLSLDCRSLPFILHFYYLFFIFIFYFFITYEGVYIIVENYGKVLFENCVNAADSEVECLLQLLVTAGYKS